MASDGYGYIIFSNEGLGSGGSANMQTKTITPTKNTQVATPDVGYDGLSKVTVNPIPSNYIVPSGTKTITTNGTHDVTAYANAEVSISSDAPELQSKEVSYTPSETAQSQTVSPDSDYDGLSSVKVNVGAISSTYVGSGIARKSSTDMTINGATVTAPAGYYSAAASKAVATGTAGTPTATKGSVSNHTISVTPSVTNVTGYITGGTKNGTAVTVSASELVSGNRAISANGTGIDVTNYATVSVSVPTGGDDPVLQEKTATPTESEQVITPDEDYDALSSVTVEAISSTYVGSGIARRTAANVSNAFETVSIPAGYYASNTTYDFPTGGVKVTSISVNSSGLVSAQAGVSSEGYVSYGDTANGTHQLDAQAAKTVTPTEEAQTAVEAGKYTTGAVTVAAIPSDYVGSDITTRSSTDLTASGATVTVPAGYYSSQASKSVASGAAGTPTASKGTVANHSISVTPSVTNTAGYISGGTMSGTAVTVSASELVSGNKAIAENGTNIDVANYATVSVNVPTGGGGSAALIVDTEDAAGGTVRTITTTDEVHLQASKSVQPTATQQVVTADAGYDGLQSVVVGAASGGDGTPSGVKFIDYDGTVLHTYTTSEFNALTQMPSNPTHTGLVADGWNWSLANAKSYMTNYPNAVLTIGQMYHTASGKTEIDITLDDPDCLSPYLIVQVSGTATVDWGDGSEEDELTGTTYTTKNIQHVYSAVGNYTISIDGTIRFYNGSSSYGGVLSTGTSLSSRKTYSRAITAIRLGVNASLSGNYSFACLYNCKSVTLYYGMKNLASYVFNHCHSLVSIVIPDGVTSIDSNAFYHCYSLASVAFPDGITYISGNMFYSCYSLTSFAIPDGVTSIANNVFYNCYAITSITIPDSVTTIGVSAFTNCYYLASITIPDGVTSIENSMFNNCRSLTSLTIPDGVTSIGSSAFQNCYRITSLAIPDSVTSIGSSAFSGCYALAPIVIPDGVTSIGANAFQYCYAITSLTIPDGVTSIANTTFSSCYALASVVIPDGVTSIGNNAFYNCCAITSLEIPDSVTTIGTSAFQSCYSLASITIPDSVTSIGGTAFGNCETLTSITIPDSVTSIGGTAFQNCYSVMEYHFEASTPPTLGATVFSNIAVGTKIYVPQGSLEAYQTAENWSTYASYMVEEAS